MSFLLIETLPLHFTGTNQDLNTPLPIEPQPTDSGDCPAKDFTIQTDFNSQSSCDVALDINVHSAVAAIGDATSFHYINEVPNTEVVLTSQTATRQDPTSLEHGKVNIFPLCIYCLLFLLLFED